jgi:hypothetical protein
MRRGTVLAGGRGEGGALSQLPTEGAAVSALVGWKTLVLLLRLPPEAQLLISTCCSPTPNWPSTIQSRLCAHHAHTVNLNEKLTEPCRHLL